MSLSVQNVLCRTGDADRTLQILEEAVSLSFTLSVWPVIALAHFHQYVRGDVLTALRLLKRCYHQRRKSYFSPILSNHSISPSSSSSSFSTSNLFSSSKCFKTNVHIIEKDEINLTNNRDMEKDNESHDELKYFEKNIEKNDFSSKQIERNKNNKIEKISLLIALSFCYFENDDIIQSRIYCNKALTLQPYSTAANRCFGFINLKSNLKEENERTVEKEISYPQHLESKGPSSSSFSSSSSLMSAAMNKKAIESSTKYFSLSFQYAHGNPYTLRCSSLSAAIRGRPVEALKLMEAAMINGSTHSLTIRSLGIMTYLYSSHLDDSTRLEKSINYIFQCIKLTPFGTPPDLEAFILLGQLLIEAKQYLQAKQILKQALKIFPINVLLLSSLGIVLSCLPHLENVRTDEMYRQDILSLTTLEDLSELEDPGSLFFSAINPELLNIVKLKCMNEKNNIDNNDKNNNNVKDEKHFLIDKSSILIEKNINEKIENNLYSSHADIYYWTGMFFLRKGSLEGILKAKKMFTLAVSSTMIEEKKEKNLEMKENQKKNNDNFDNTKEDINDRKTTKHHPLSVYMLGWISEIEGDLISAEKLYTYVIQLNYKTESYKFLQLLAAIKQILNSTRKCLQIELKSKTKKSGKKKFKKIIDGEMTNSVMNNFVEIYGSGTGDESEKLLRFKLRIFLHEKMLELGEIQKMKMFDLCDSLCVPSNFVFIEENWKERLLVAFSQCDDWSWLLKSELNIIKNKKIFDENIDKVNVNNNS